MQAKILLWFLKATKALFGSDNFTRAILTFVTNKQHRRNVEHEERTEVREEQAKGDVLKKKRRTARIKKRLDKKNGIDPGDSVE